MGIGLNKLITDSLRAEGVDDVKTYSPLTLAYIGDAVYELIIRSCLVKQKDMPVQKYHKKCSQIVNAASQKELILAVEELLTEEELSIFKRGRNAKSNTMPKNASPGDYRNATGFEALCGYLYLTDRIERLLEIIGSGIGDKLKNEPN